MTDDELLERLRGLHDRIRRRVLDLLASGARAKGLDPASDEAGVAAEGAGDVTFRIDVPAEEEVEHFVRDLGARMPVRVISEGAGDRTYGTGEPDVRLVFDPVDGTRPLMFDMRSGWILSAVAAERGDATSLADVRMALQTEIPVSDRRSFVELFAKRGQGASLRRRDLATGRVEEERPLSASPDARLDNGVYVFFKFGPECRGDIGRIEERFLTALVQEHGVDPRTLYDDQYISSAGQLYLMITQRYRFLADLRGFVGDRTGSDNFTSKPYDVCCSLIAEEAGIPLTDPEGGPLRARLDLDGRVSFVAYANDGVRAQLEPLLQEVLREGFTKA